ncbi:hypothetical protein [Photorhabdus sp. RM323S]
MCRFYVFRALVQAHSGDFYHRFTVETHVAVTVLPVTVRFSFTQIVEC